MSLTKVSYSMIKGAVVNVLDYGADPTGITDSSTAINAALATGKTVYIPTGNYLISSSLTPTTQQTIYGDGPKDSVLKAGTLGMTVISYPSAIYSNIEINNIGLESNSLGARGISLIGSSQGAVSYCRFWNIEAGDFSDVNLYFEQIQGCFFYNIASVNVSSLLNYAIYFNKCYDTHIVNSLFTSGNVSTVGIFAGTKVTFTNVYLYNIGGGVESLLEVDGGFSHSFIDCSFEPQGVGGTTVAAVNLKVTGAAVDEQMADVSFMRCSWVGLPGTVPYNVQIGTVGACFRTRFQDCVFTTVGPTTFNLISQADTSIINCNTKAGFFGLTYVNATVTNTSGNPFYQEGLPGFFANSVISGNEILGLKISPSTFLVPSADNTVSCGTAGFRWTEVFAVAPAINTSDEREKTFLTIENEEKKAALEIKNNLRKFKFNHAIEKKGDNARIHFGVAAQEIGRIMESHSLDPHKYGFFCYDEWEQQTDSNGKVVLEAGSRYGVRYEELLCFIMAAI